MESAVGQAVALIYVGPYLVNTTSATGTGTSITISTPSGIQTGDVLIMAVWKAYAATFGTINTLTGWELIYTVNHLAFWMRVADGTEGANYSPSWATSGNTVGFIQAYRDADTTDPIAGIAYNNGSGTTITWKGLHVTPSNVATISTASQGRGNLTYTTNGGYIQDASADSGGGGTSASVEAVIAHRLWVQAGDIPQSNFTSTASAAWEVFHVMLRYSGDSSLSLRSYSSITASAESVATHTVPDLPYVKTGDVIFTTISWNGAATLSAPTDWTIVGSVALGPNNRRIGLFRAVYAPGMNMVFTWSANKLRSHAITYAVPNARDFPSVADFSDTSTSSPALQLEVAQLPLVSQRSLIFVAGNLGRGDQPLTGPNDYELLQTFNTTFGGDIRSSYSARSNTGASPPATFFTTTNGWTGVTKHFAVSEVGASLYVNAQAVGTIYVPNFSSGNAQADILTDYTQFGQANASIRPALLAGYGQAQTNIIRVTSRTGQAVALIGHFGYALSQAYLRSFDQPVFGQALGRIKQVYVITGQVRALIVNIYGFGLSLAQIKSTRGRATGQARALIDIFVRWREGNTQAQIKQRYDQYAQARASILPWKFSSQALGTIKQTYNRFGQAGAILNTGFGLAHARSWIERTENRSGNAHARIKQTYLYSGQAQAHIRIRFKESGQAMAVIVTKRWAFGQAMAYIGNLKHGHAQAQILGFNVPKTGNAIGYIQGNIIIPPSTPTSLARSYLVRFNGYDIPGYAQAEAYDSLINTVKHQIAYMDFTLAEYNGLVNKSISLDMALWEPSYRDVKDRMELAATLLRSPKGFAKLYIQSTDKYFLGMVKGITTSQEVRSPSTVMRYNIEFETKPWVISDALYEVSGTGLIETTGRTLSDGTWTPTRLLVSGTDVVITGINEYGMETGRIETSGVSAGLVIDTEEFTATMAGIDRSDLIVNKDFSLYVGPGVTYFTVTNATSCVIQYNNRWLFSGGPTTLSLQERASQPIIDVKGPPSVDIDGIDHGLARATISSPIKRAHGNAEAFIDSPIKNVRGQANAQIRQTRFAAQGNSAAAINSPRKQRFGQARATMLAHEPLHKIGLVRARVKTRYNRTGLVRGYVSNPYVPPTSPSGEDMPTSNPTGWTRIFEDDFNDTIAEGQFSVVNSSKWGAYPSTWFDTSNNGMYSPNVISQHDSMLDMYLRQINGIWRVAAPTPKLPATLNYKTKLRIAVRFKATQTLGFKTAWLLWPDSNNWPPDGEIDFPEGDLPGTISGFMHRQDATWGGDQDYANTSATYAQWHTAIIEWEAGIVCRFILDGVTIGQWFSRVPSKPMHYVMQTETRLSGGPPPAGAQAHVYVDWFVVWTK